MILKEREESKELRILRSLNARMKLEPQEIGVYQSAEKGFEGEKKFDELAAEPLGDKMIFLNDLLLEHKNTHFQLDSVGLNTGKLFLFEVKNLEGDYIIEGEKWKHVSSGKEVKSPILQMQRAESMLRQMLDALRMNISVVPYLIFVNPKFYLYNPPLNLPIVYSPQLDRFMSKLQKQTSTIKKSDIKLAEKLLSYHLEESPYSRLPEYRYEDLRKGIVCCGCGGFYENFSRLTLKCGRCESKENCSVAMMRIVEEFKLLFPSEKITTNQIYEFCNFLISKRTIRNFLSDNFYKQGYGNHVIYLERK